jgi:surface antigen
MGLAGCESIVSPDAYVSGKIGQTMDPNDRTSMGSAYENNAVGQPANWRNAKTGASYEITPLRNVTVKGNRYCRQYHLVAHVRGKKHQGNGTACRQADGSWRTMND